MNNTIKKIISLLLVFVLLIPTTIFADNNEPVKVTLNNKEVNFKIFGVEPFIKDSRTFIPLRAIFEEMGATVKWIDETNGIIIKREDIVLSLNIGNKTMTVSNKGVKSEVIMDTAPYIKNGRTVVPLSFISRALDSYVGWNDKTRSVYVVDAVTFYNSFKKTPSKEVVNELNNSISIVNDDYKVKLNNMKMKIEKDFKNEFLNFDFIDRIEKTIGLGDKNELSKIENEVNVSPLTEETKIKLKSKIKEARDYIDGNILKIATTKIEYIENAIKNSPGENLTNKYTEALNLVNQLVYSKEKQSLLDRLAKANVSITNMTKYLDAENKLNNYRNNKTIANLTIAKTAIEALPSGTEKTKLLTTYKQLEYEYYLLEATTLVIKVETTKSYADYEIAYASVNKLSSGTDKTNLQNRLKAIKEQVDASLITESKNAVIVAEKLITQESYDVAKKMIDKMPSSTVKNELIDRLGVVKILIEVEVYVKKAETSGLQEDVTNAKSIVSKRIKSTETLKYYNDRLDKVQKLIDSKIINDVTNLVIKAEWSFRRPDYRIAKSAVEKLKLSDEKIALQNRIKALEPLMLAYYPIYATEVVNYTISNPTEENLAFAYNEVRDVEDFEIKKVLTDKLDEIARMLEGIRVEKAIVAVNNAIETRAKTDIDNAKALVNILWESDIKKELNHTIELLRIDNSIIAVAKVESTLSQYDLGVARNLVNELMPSEEKNELTAWLNFFQQVIDYGTSIEEYLKVFPENTIKHIIIFWN